MTILILSTEFCGQGSLTTLCGHHTDSLTSCLLRFLSRPGDSATDSATINGSMGQQ